MYWLQWARSDTRGKGESTSRKGKMDRECISQDQAACSKRCRNRGSLARPYIDRLTNLSLWTWASTGPLLTESVSPAMTASLSLHKLCAKRPSSAIELAWTAESQFSKS